MTKIVRYVLLGASILLLTAGILFVRLLRHGFSAHDQPTEAEAMIARAVRRWASPADLRNEKNPLPETHETLADARSHFADHCAVCHGNDGKGQTTLGRHLYPRAPDMSLEATQSLSDGELFAIIENGIRLTGMPGWGDGTAESARGSWSLVHFIRHLPKISEEEVREMEKMNPMTAEQLEQMKEEEAFLGGQDETLESKPRPTRSPHSH